MCNMSVTVLIYPGYLEVGQVGLGQVDVFKVTRTSLVESNSTSNAIQYNKINK